MDTSRTSRSGQGHFYHRKWNSFGTREGLSEEISAATGIEVYMLIVHQFWRSAYIAAKMSWLSGRVTSRVEDMAYCMLGLFDVNMSLLYGEGAKAFLRLQLEIIKKLDDESIFAWTSSQPSSGMLASEPRFFAESEDIRSCGFTGRSSYLMTNKGLEFQVPYRRPNVGEGEYHDRHEDDLSIALNCKRPGDELYFISIHLRRFPWGWQRVHCDEFTLSETVDQFKDEKGRKSTTVIHIPQKGL